LATKIQLLRNEVETLAANVSEIPWHSYVALVLGYLFIAAVLLVALFVAIDVLSERRWLRKPEPDPDVHPSVLCTCPTFYDNTTNANHTAVPTIQTWTRQNPKCPIHSTAGRTP
jgi:hypothetical protein